MSSYGRGASTGYGGGRQEGGGGGYDEPSVDMYVPAEECGRIIGRGGSKIKELQENSGCRIKVHRDDDGHGSRRVQLMGSDVCIEEARNLINQILEGGDDRDRRGGGGDRGGSKEVIQIDSSFVGRVIGKQGSRVRELQDETGCRINVSRDAHGTHTDVELIGSRGAIQAAREAIDYITSQVY